MQPTTGRPDRGGAAAALAHHGVRARAHNNPLGGSHVATIRGHRPAFARRRRRPGCGRRRLARGRPVPADLRLPHRPYAPSGIPIANGFKDYFTLLNERDGGIEGVKIVSEECETQYDTKQGVECYER